MSIYGNVSRFGEKNSAGENVLRTTDTNSILKGISYDAISAAYPNATTEVYSYFIGGLAGTLQATITVVYTDATKDCISTVVRA